MGQWDRDLTRVSRKEFAKLLVAGRVDAGGLRVSRSEVEKFAGERKFRGFLETGAKKNLGCEELKEAILAGINWDEIPCRTTEVLFKRLKEEIIRLKDKGRVLMRFNELRETLQLRLSGEFKRFTDEERFVLLAMHQTLVERGPARTHLPRRHGPEAVSRNPGRGLRQNGLAP